MTIDVEYFIMFHPQVSRFFLGSRSFVGSFNDEVRRIPILINDTSQPSSARRFVHSQNILEDIRRHDNQIQA